MRIASSEQFEEIVSTVKRGGIIIAPTDTVYGVIARAEPHIIERVYELKGRPEDKRVPLFVSDIGMATDYVEISDTYQQLIDRFWPGQVTVICQSNGKLAAYKEGTIAVRAPDAPLIQSIVAAVAFPLTGTSANISGQPVCASAQEAFEVFSDRAIQPELIVEPLDRHTAGADMLEGVVPGRVLKKPSTIIDLTGDEPQLIRDGAVPFGQIEKEWQGIISN